ncbi:stage II sporulation protein M [bacterium]|nr:stage II sporulation protein M [bacterium]
MQKILQGSTTLSLQNTQHICQLHDQLSLYIHQLRRDFSTSELQDFEDTYFQLSQSVLSLQDHHQRNQSYFRLRYRAIWKKHFDLFIISLQLFTLAFFVGLFMGWHKPEYAQLFLSQGMAERIMNHQDWFDGLRQSPLSGGFAIAWNNIQVCINVFLMSALVAVGGIFLLVFNGFHVGFIIAFCARYGFSDALIQFITTHGILELTLIVASCFSGLIMGQEFFKRRQKLSFATRFKQSSKDGFTVLLGLLPWIALAAVFEAFASPFTYLSMTQKIFIGCFITACFWLYTFLPAPKKS